MEIVFLVVAIVFGAVVSIVLAINMRMSGEIARLRGELAELERSRTEISGMLSETRDAVGNADRLMKSLRTELRAEIDQKLKSGGG
jgi:hypothetical protein